MQLFRGKKLRFKIVRCKLDGKRKSVTLDVNISPGTLHGTQIIFKAAGHEMKNGTRQDIIFIVEEAKHERFVRLNEDLALDVRLPWVENLKKEIGAVHVKSLDGKEFKFEVDFKTDGNVTGTARIPDAGMPIPKTKKRGDLIVR
jgi:DnaJ-class molecular chaperone